VRLPDLIRATTFRRTLAIACAFAIYIALLFGFVYWRTEMYLTARSDAVITVQAKVFAAAPPDKRLDAINLILQEDPRMVHYAGLFAPDGKRLAGNLQQLPSDLRVDGRAQPALFPLSDHDSTRQSVRAIARRLADGSVLAIGRNVDERAEFAKFVGEALALGLIPALCLCIAAGALISVRTQRRVDAVNKKVNRIVAGDLRERLPARGSDDPLDRLAAIFNGMLDEIETLVQQIAGVGDDIAHDLRTPLTRVRVGLERGRANARTIEEAQAVIDRGIRGLDQSLSIVTALLRIAEIEHNRRLAEFGNVSLAEVIREVGDLYEPIAEEKGVGLHVQIAHEPVVCGDRDLILEAVANLTDNAIKFTPAGGQVNLALIRRAGENIVRITDTGPGVTNDERDIVTRRFYRSDRSRQTRGVGLGLSLVAAILKLHGFRFTISTGPGCVAEITCCKPDGALPRACSPDNVRAVIPPQPLATEAP
jgi:signal transduction histidine kinase